MKPVPFCGASTFLYTCLTPCLAQDLLPHREAAKQSDAYLPLADDRIIVLSERLRELKSQGQRLTTLEDALSKVTLQKSKLEAELLDSSEEDSASAELEYALSDAQRTSNAYQEETERLRQDVIRLSQSTEIATASQERLDAIEREHADALRQLKSERKAAKALELARSSSDAKAESSTKERRDTAGRSQCRQRRANLGTRHAANSDNASAQGI